jgi:DNA/RNA endonuclease YhcR with UshA esterase domain
MSIRDLKEKINTFANSQKGRDIYIILVVILVALASFGLGRLSKIEESKPSIRIDDRSSPRPGLGEVGEGAGVVGKVSIEKTIEKIERKYVASKNGTKYHHPWCPGAQRMKEENKIWFDTKEDAEKAGYGPAANCKGL